MHSTYPREALLALLAIVSLPAEACLLEAADPQDGASVARVSVTADCPTDVALVAHVSTAGGQALGSRRFEPPFETTLAIDTATMAPATQRAGVFEVLWSPEAPSGAARGAGSDPWLEQLVTVPCPAPPSLSHEFEPDAHQLTFLFPAGDECQGETTAILELSNLAGEAALEPITRTFGSATDSRIDFFLPQLEGDQRYDGVLTLSNDTGQSTQSPLSFVTVCGDIGASAEILAGVLSGKVQGSSCHFPVTLGIAVRAVDNRVLSETQTDLTQTDFRYVLPGIESWAAGDYTVDLTFTSANGRQASVAVDQSIPCTPPILSDAHIDATTDANRVTLNARYLSADPCHAQSEIALQLRDTNRVVVYSRTVTAAVAAQPTQIQLPVDIIAGDTYEVSATVRYGANLSQTTSFRQTLSTSCSEAAILDVGLTDAEASAIGGLVRVSDCNMPATAELEIRDASDALIMLRSPNVVKSHDGRYATVGPVAIRHLETGEYQATLTLTDAQGRASVAKTAIPLDVDGPLIDVRHRAVPLGDGDVPVVSDLDQLTVTYTDASSLLPQATELYAGVPELDARVATGTVQEISGEAEAQMVIAGYLDIPRTDQSPGLVGVVLRDAGGKKWVAPITRTFTPLSGPALAEFHPSRQRLGFRSLFRTASLEPGQHRVVGVLIDRDGRQSQVAASASFSVSSLVKRRPNVFLTQGVSEIPLTLTFREEDDAISTASVASHVAVPDGSYSLTVSGQDRYGNRAEPTVVVFEFEQDKDQRLISQPAIAGQRFSVRHRFVAHATGQATRENLTLSVRRVSGQGSLSLNGKTLSSLTHQMVSRPSTDGTHTFEFELLEADVDTRYVVFAQRADLRPLQIAITSFKPRFDVALNEGVDGPVLTVRDDQPACPVETVFRSLSEISLSGEQDLVCALRVSLPEAVLEREDGVAVVQLPADVDDQRGYELGFVRLKNGIAAFHVVESVSLAALETIALAPTLTFEPVASLKDRSVGSTTRVGPFRPGFLLVRTQRPNAVVQINGIPHDPVLRTAGVHRIPISTNVERIGDTDRIDARAYYESTPEHASVQVLTFVAIPAPVSVTAVAGQLVAPQPLSVDLEVTTVGTAKAPSSTHDFRRIHVVSRDRPADAPINVSFKTSDRRRTFVALPKLAPGDYALQTTVVNTDARVAEHLNPIRGEVAFTVVDGSPVRSGVFTFRRADVAPFVGTLSLSLADPARIYDIESTTWEVARDDGQFVVARQGPATFDFTLRDPGALSVRARVRNRHSGTTFETDPLVLSAHQSLDFDLAGPAQTFQGRPVTIKAQGIKGPVLWRVSVPGSSIPEEITATEVTLDADATGVVYIEAIATPPGDRDPSSLRAERRYKAVEVIWPRIPPSSIVGPTNVELGRTATYRVTHPSVFQKDDDNVNLRRVGEWELPDGSRVPDQDWVDVTLNSMPDDGYENILYHAWLEGRKDRTLVTAVHRVAPFDYVWPSWKLNAQTVDVELPSLHRLSVVPEDWQQWFAIPGSAVKATFDLPSFARVVYRKGLEIVFEVNSPRRFDVNATVSDSRGNVSDVTLSNIAPTARVPFQIAGRLVPERALHTAPIQVEVTALPTVIPNDREISTVSYYLDGVHVGSSNGEPMLVDIRTSGIHDLRVVATLGYEWVAEDSITFEVGDNLPADCNISTIGDFRENGIAKAVCSDPDGHMVDYRWYLDGQLIDQKGPRVHLTPREVAAFEVLSLIGRDSAGNDVTARLLNTAREP